VLSVVISVKVFLKLLLSLEQLSMGMSLTNETIIIEVMYPVLFGMHI
jgi:hypothetical protein